MFAAGPFIAGVCTHFQQGKGVLDSNLRMIRAAGVTSIRDEASWNAVERVKGQLAMPEQYTRYVDRALAAGIQPLLVLDYGNRFYDNGGKPLTDDAIEGFARYAEFVVRHFKGKIKLYEVWNEWDIKIGGTEPGDADTYTKLLKVVYPRIKKIDPSIVVMAGAMTSGGIRKGWLDRMLAAGALTALDAVSIHTYNYSGRDRERTPEAWFDFVVKAEDAIKQANNGREIPLYVSEMGWPTHTGPRSTSPQQSAAFLARMFLLGRTLPYLKGIWWYDFQDDGWKPEYNENNFGMVRPDLTPKPSYHALASLSSLVAEGQFVSRIDSGNPDVIALRFRHRNQDVLALWSAQPAADHDFQVELQNAATVQEVGRPAIAGPLPSVTLRDTPFLITGQGVQIGAITVR